jgi:CIC family chloride channel protein
VDDRFPGLARLAVTTVVVGVGAGLAGIAASLLLHSIEHLAFSYQQGTLLEALGHTQPWQRVAALAAAGVIGGFGWWALRKWGRPIVSIGSSISGRAMPAVTTLIHAALQLIIVGLGASIGREVAPRELGALLAGGVTRRARVTGRARRVLVACGAGAGLAAVYHVPLGGAMFTVEVLLVDFTPATVILALATSGIATLVSSLVIPSRPFYALPPVHDSVSLLCWAALAGPALGLGATAFSRLAARAEAIRPRTWWITVTMPVVFTLVGVLSIALPAILGNGRALGQTAFDARMPLALIGTLLVAKAVATLATIGSGAHGGILTPSFAIGAALGTATGGLWLMWWPGSEVWAFALVAAASFLAGSMAAPMTALLLTLEFTGTGTAVIGPMVLAVAGAAAVRWLVDRRNRPARRAPGPGEDETDENPALRDRPPGAIRQPGPRRLSPP